MKINLKSVLPILTIVTFLLLASLVSASLATIVKSEKTDEKTKTAIKSTAKPTMAPSPSPGSAPLKKDLQKIQSTSKKNLFPPAPIPSPLPTSVTMVQSIPTITTSEQSSQTPKNLEVNLSINGSSGFMVSLEEGASHCDVLSKAKEVGKISSLNMRYDPNLETNAVYQINGIGKENAVWWIFKVNGESPTKGCSYIKVNHEDKVEWSYIGNDK